MKNISSPVTSSSLSSLPALSVIRAKYCSQKMTDEALQYLWDQKPALVSKLMKMENNFDPEYMDELGRVIDFFRNEASKVVTIPTTKLGMMDLLFELSRRLRILRGLPEWEITGKPLADSPDGPMPELPSLPIKKSPAYSFITQEIADKTIDEAYRSRPDLFYEFAEQIRRGGCGPWEIFNELKQVLSRPELGIKGTTASHLGGEVNRRLRNVCGMPKAPGEK